MAAGAVSLRKSHDIVISSFCNIVKGRANNMQVYASNAQAQHEIMKVSYSDLLKLFL